MPDLGKYAAEVLTAYGVSLAALGLIIGLSVLRSRRIKRALAKEEAKR